MTLRASEPMSDCLASQGESQARRSRRMALRMVRSLRMAAVRATLPGRRRRPSIDRRRGEAGCAWWRRGWPCTGRGGCERGRQRSCGGPEKHRRRGQRAPSPRGQRSCGDRGGRAQGDLAPHPQWHVVWFPPYAPELNPVEQLWTYLKYGRRANFAPRETTEIRDAVRREQRRLDRHPALLRSFFRHSDLPFPVWYWTLLTHLPITTCRAVHAALVGRVLVAVAGAALLVELCRLASARRLHGPHCAGGQRRQRR
jgi:hypothetical protein